MTGSRLHRWLHAATRALRAVAAASLARAPEGLRLGGRAVQAKACLLACAFAAVGAQAATPPNTSITNAATASFTLSGVPISATASTTVVTTAGTPATVQFLSYPTSNQAGAGASRQNIPVTQCSKGGTFSALAAPSMPGRGTMSVPNAYPLAATSLYASGDVAFVQVTDYDQNLDPLVADTITVTVSAGNGDSEVLRLTETGLSTGVFLGYLPTSNGAVVAGNCVLNVGNNQRLTATYIDDSENHVAVSAGALIDPFGVVFDTSTGQPVSGARVTLIDLATGLSATVFGNDGISSYPSSVVTGSTVTDGGGEVYALAPGQYQFPRLAPGNYQLRVEPPTGYRFPSTASLATIQALSSGPYAIVTGSRGEPFVLVPGPALQIDLPVDPGPLGELNITKSAGKTVAAIGDFVPYALALTNRGANAIPAVTLADRLPPGFRYQKGSARLDDAPLPDPQVAADGRSLQFSLGAIPGNGSVTLRYVALIGAGAKTGIAENTAQALGRVLSNTAKAAIVVREDLNRTRAMLVGRVALAQSCEQDERQPGAATGLKDVRVLLQDGTTVLTDANGNWHVDNLRPGTHVVQIDTTTLPQGVELRNCDRASRTGGRDFSQMVNVRGGTLWRADFRLVRTGGAPLAPAGARAPAAAAPAATRTENAGDSPALVEKLPYDDKWLAAAAPGNEWLHPKAGFTPALPLVKVAVKHARGSAVTLKVNGQPVDPLRYEGAVLSPDGEWQLSNWRSVNLVDGANVLETTIRDAQGATLLEERRTIHYSVTPARVVLDAQRSRLVADGRTQPLLAVRLLDRLGKPVRKGLSGEFVVDAPHVAQQQVEALQRDPLSGNLGGKPKFQIGDDGIALIALQPTTRSGEVVLHFDFGENRVQEVRAWLEAELREWVLVGFAEGTLGRKRLEGNMEALRDSGVADQLFDQDRIAFYAKGQVKGEYLLTAAYDSAKEQGTGARTALKQVIDPAQYYTLYGDATQAQADAASTGKLYLKIEKKHFYALFGDHDTGLTVTELGRYSRTLTGLKSEYKGERFSYNAFAARTSQSFMKDELQGDGTSGLYRLRSRNILLNSEKVRIEVRDRFQPDRVLSSRSLTPYIDYSIDSTEGTLMFREPVASRDASFNLVFIVVEYESDDQANERWTYGGRAAMRVGEKNEVGLTRVHEGNAGREATLTAVDATVRLGDTTKLRAEVATSRRETANGGQSGNAYLVEATHDDGKLAARTYASEQQPNFGLGQQTQASQGQRKIGADARLKVTDQVQVQGEAYRQEDLTSGANRQVAEARAQWIGKEGFTLSGGARTATEEDGAGKESRVNQVTSGVAYETMERKLVLRASTELDVGSQSSTGTTNFPNRVLLGADYRITPQTAVFAQHEIARGDAVQADTTRIGLRTQLWTGAEAQVGAGSQATLDADRLYASMGLVQRLKLSEHWSAHASVDRVNTLRTTANPLGPAQPLASGTTTNASYGLLTEDYTAVSMGLAYLDDVWSANARAEWRGSASSTKVNLVLGAQRRLDRGRVVAAGLVVTNEQGSAPTRNVSARLSYAFRPDDSNLIWLNRLEYVEQGAQIASRLFTRKLINNFNANWKANPRTQVAFQYSAKYVSEMLGDTTYSGYTDLVGLEMRHDIAQDWDVGLHAGMLHSWKGGGRSYQMGLSVGYRMATNTWVTVGYNHAGFQDADFSGSEYRAKGVYVNLRVKFDQDTFDLNDRTKGQLPLKP